MRRISVLALLPLAALLVTSSAYAASMLSNGGFETGDLTDWTCDDTCSVDDAYNYAGSYHAIREADSTLTQSQTVQACESYRLFWAARQYSAGTHAVSADFGDCDPASDTYTPIEPGEGWSLHYLDIPACEGDQDITVQFSGSGGTELDGISLDCLPPQASVIEPYTEVLDDGQTLAVYPTFSFGELAIFLAASFAVAGQVLVVGLLVIMRRRLMKWQ